METDRIPPLARQPAPIVVEISDTQSHLAADHPALEGLARRVLLSEGVDRASISIALVDDATIHALNRRHLAHDWPTDVISFGLSEPGELTLSGELVVSAEMAASTARDSGVDPASELALYVVHGLLHLCGLDDQSPEDADVMRRREGEILDAEGLVNTFPLVGPASADEPGGRVCLGRFELGGSDRPRARLAGASRYARRLRAGAPDLFEDPPRRGLRGERPTGPGRRDRAR